jgi:hypothetical protein
MHHEVISLPAMGIPTSTRCSCGAYVNVNHRGYPSGLRWEALCRDCYDGTEDAGPRAHVRGFGDTIDDALWDWQDNHDETHGVEWVPNELLGELSRQVSEEAERQRGWSLRCAGSGAPAESCPPTGELVYGPPDAPMEASA